MSERGTFITVKVDPDTNLGFDVAPALVVGKHEDGTLAVRVLSASGSTGDTVRNYVGEDGEPYDYGNGATTSATSPAPAATGSGPVGAGAVGVSQQPPATPAAPAAPAVPTLDQLRELSPADRAQLLAELEQLDNAQPPTTDGSPGAGAQA